MTVSAPRPENEADRLAALRRYAILDTEPEESFDRIVRLASRHFDVPIALISLVDAERQWFKATCGLDATESERDVALCAHTILGDDVLYVADAREDKRFADNPFVTGSIKIRFYAGAPLITPDGFKLGTLCLIDQRPRHDFSEDDKAALADLAAIVSDQIELRYATSDVLSEVEGRIKAEEAVRESEERYRSLYNNTPVMLHSIDCEGRLVSVSDYWLERLGYKRDEVIGQKSIEFLTPESREKAVTEILPAFMQTGTCKDVEYQMVSKSGEVIDVLVSAIAEKSSDGSVIRSLAVLTDITKRKTFEQQFLQAQKMESVGQLTGGLAHDFNNLLGVILGNLQLIERSVTDNERATRRIRAALNAVDRGAELTRRLLAFSRRQNLEPTVIEPNPMIDELSGMLRRTLGESIALTCKLQDDVPSVQTDPAQLESAILNLAVNARDAMPNGGRLTIESSAVHLDKDAAAGETDVAPGDYVAISVTDNGTGIPADMLDKVFEPFFTMKEVGKGSGLGLSMVYGFIRQSGGHVRILSEVGKGTTVRMYLPVAAPGSQPEQRSTTHAGEDVGGHEMILVVEDQRSVRRVAVGLLTDLGYRVVEAANGPQGLAALEANPQIDVLFTDIVMPGGMDGTELAKAARELRPDLPVVFTTGYAKAAILHEGDVKAGSNLVKKPYRRSDLAEIIRKALDSKQAVRAAVSSAA